MGRNIEGSSIREVARRSRAARLGKDLKGYSEAAIRKMITNNEGPATYDDGSLHADQWLAFLGDRTGKTVSSKVAEAPAGSAVHHRAAPLLDSDPSSFTSARDLEQWAKARKLDAERRIKEADAAEREGALVPIAEVRADATAIVAELRSKLQVLGSRLAGLVADRTVPEAQAVIDEAVNDVLAVLHEVKYADDAPPVGDDEPCPVCGRGPAG